MGLAGHRIRPCYLGDCWGVGGAPIFGGRGGVRFKATAPGSLCGSLENTRLMGHKTAKICPLLQ